VVEYDAFDDLKNEYTSRVAVNTMTDVKITFAKRSLERAISDFEVALKYCDPDDVRAARRLLGL